MYYTFLDWDQLEPLNMMALAFQSNENSTFIQFIFGNNSYFKASL